MSEKKVSKCGARFEKKVKPEKKKTEKPKKSFGFMSDEKEKKKEDVKPDNDIESSVTAIDIDEIIIDEVEK